MFNSKEEFIDDLNDDLRISKERIAELEQKVQDMLMANMTMVKLLEKKHTLLDEAIEFLVEINENLYDTNERIEWQDKIDPFLAKVRDEKCLTNLSKI